MMAPFAASSARSSPDPTPMPMSAEPAPVMIERTSAKSRLMSPGVVMSDVIPSTPWNRTWSAIRKASTIGVVGSDTWSSRSFGTTMSVSTAFLSSRDAEVRLRRTHPSLEAERPGHDADRERPDLARDLRDDRRGAGARSAAFTGGDEDHVRALQDLLDLVAVLVGGVPPDLRVRARAETPRRLASDVELHLGLGHEQGLRIGVHRDELHAAQPAFDHAVDGVHAAPADPDHLDDGEVVLRRIHHCDLRSPGGSPPRSTWGNAVHCLPKLNLN